ncbi:MAG: DUF4395 domain-containing protein [Acidimicrobiia bacterium]|nr:DUF4395 domain-containing protein [Acidimicrobiia bacterium]
MSAPATVDVNVPRFNQVMVAALVGAAFVLQWWPLVAITAGILALTRFGGPRLGVFTQTYVRMIRPRMAGPIEHEAAAPPRFAQLLGTVFLGAATVLFVVGWPVAAWAVAVAVFALAMLAATTRICVGCIIYDRAVA